MSNSTSYPETGKPMADSAFAALGDGEVAYVRTLTAADVRSMFPQAPTLAPGLKVWALLGADGTPILLTDSREAAIANARQNDLTPVGLH